MTTKKCPLCQQPLPRGVDHRHIDAKMRQLARPLLAEERKAVREELRTSERRKAEAKVKKEVSALARKEQKARRRLEEHDREHRRRLQAFRRDARTQADAKLKREVDKIASRTAQKIAKATRKAERASASTVKSLEDTLEKERKRRDADTARLHRRVEELNRRLERVQNERRGEEAEVELYAALKKEFPSDHVERVGRGKRGADVLHRLIVRGVEVGCIIYESKDTQKWNKSFVAKARTYRRRYQTPYVVVVSRTMPPRKEGLCVVGDIPVVQPRMAVALAGIIRDAVVELARLRDSSKGRAAKAQKLHDYVTSNEFVSRFRDIAEAVAELSERQQAERDWHERDWVKRDELRARIASSRQHVDAKIRAAVSSPRRAGKRKLRIVGT